MRRTLILSLLAVLMVGLFVPQADGDSAMRRRVVRFHGVIAQVGDHGLTMQVGDRSVEVRVVERTRIFLNGERVRLAALHRGDRAFVRAVVIRRGDRRILVATHIRARRRG